jgi:hypothetical protein
MRKIGTFIFVTLSLLSAFLTIMNSSMAENTIQHSREIEKSFALTSTFVENFKAVHARLPNETEFSAWANTQSHIAYLTGMELETSQDKFPQEVREKFGRPLQGGYVIKLWRGEWYEYFVSWANASTLEFDPKKYYLLSGPIIDDLVGFASSIIFGFMAYFLWPRPTDATADRAPVARSG